MLKRALGAFAALCLLAGCVTVPPSTEEVATWQGYNVRSMIPPLELVAPANRAQAEGRVSIRAVPFSFLVSNCRADGLADQILGCTVRRGNTYTLYVDEQFPFWYRELIATHEFGHVGQYELGLPLDHVGFHNPSADLIQRVGG